MSCFGFYADIAGVKHLLKTDEEKVIGLIYGLGNDLHKIGEYSSRQNIGRLFVYQMGDGFMVQFDNVKYSSQNCHGTPDDMINFAVVLVQRFLVFHKGILHIGIASGEIYGLSESGFTFTNHANHNNGNGHHCGHGRFYLLPIMGTLLARAYSLTNQDVESKTRDHQPRLLIHSDLYDLMPETFKKHLQEIKVLGEAKSKEPIYLKTIDHDQKNKHLYQEIWGETITPELISESLGHYNRFALTT